jgi:hypothetical protein
MWSADFVLATEDPIHDVVSLAIGSLTLAGYAFRQSTFAGQRFCRLIAGFGGWRKIVPPKTYSLASGVRVSLVLRDVASEVGEKVNVQADRAIGTKYVREECPASRVLRQVSPSWYVDENGVTQVADRPVRKVSSAFTVVSHDGAAGRVVVATEDYAAWMPGATFSSPFISGTFTANGVEIRLTDDGTARLEVLV